MLPIAILAGGLATRLRPLTAAIPKVLMDVNGEPFIIHQLRLLRGQQIKRVVLCVSYRGEMIRDLIGKGESFGMHVDYVFDGPFLLGTAGAIKKALPLLGEAFFVIYGDSYLPCNFGTVQRSFFQSGKQALMTVFPNQGLWDVSNVEFAAGEIVAYDKRNRTPRMRHIDYGLGLFRASAFANVPEKEPYELSTLYQKLLERGQLASYEVHQRFYEVGSFEGLKETSEFLRKRKVERKNG
jgi:NDP-sugar pyrophosphorylase family protein